MTNNITADHLNFTAFFDETGSITNDTPEIFGGSLFIIENSDIEQCREFLKTYYPKGIHCRELRKTKLLKVSEDVGTFLKDKNCCAVTNIQINKKLMEESKPIIESRHPYQVTKKDLSLLKRFYNYAAIPRNSLFGTFNLINSVASQKKIRIEIFMEHIIRDETIDHWNLYSESLKRSIEIYKIIEPFKSFFEKKSMLSDVQMLTPESKTKKEEIMFSFPDLFAYSIRKIITHEEYSLYKKLKHIFDKFPFGAYHYLNQFKKLYNGIFIEYIQAEELNRLSELSEREWYEELK